MATLLKTVVYRGGVVRFRIPANWQEEYEPAGGGMFYAPGDQTGTLRLNVTTAQIPADNPLSPVDPQKVLEDLAGEDAAEVRTIRPGVAWYRSDLRTIERGRSIVIRSWHIAHAISATDLRIALFTHTLLAEQFNALESLEELELIERELVVAEFAATLGLAGEQGRKAKPWWRFW